MLKTENSGTVLNGNDPCCTLSICCFRYVAQNGQDLNQLNRRIHRQLVHNGNNIPSTTMVDGKLAIRPCFIGARTGYSQAIDLVDEVLQIGKQLIVPPSKSTTEFSAITQLQ